MKRQLLFIFFLFLATIGHGQSGITGKVVDKSDHKPLVNASIVILNQDSILKHFTRANENGRFEIKNIDKGDYLMLVTYPKFEIISKPLKIEDKDIKLEDIEVNSQMNLIEEVVVTQRIPIRIKGDTIEYDAASFETEKNAKLEDLLRRLPGLTVSGDGQITAQGKSVSKVLIDGEEFFGYDPKIAIRNVRADAVDKVQVYERKSEEAELTGIDDGVRLQTVNVVLKEEARKGIFGNAEANYGTEKLYTGNLFAAKFNRTERMGITANTNNMGGGGSGRESGLRTNSLITGTPRNTSLGANYENQLFNKKLNVNGNYNFNNGSNRNERTNYNKEIISPTDIQETNSTSKNENSNQGHNIRTQFKWRVDSTSNMEVRVNGNIGKTTSSSESENLMTDAAQDSLRLFSSNNESFGNTSSNDIRINYRKRLNKRGASINAHLSNDYNQSNNENRVRQDTYFYEKDSVVNINQNRVSDTYSNNFSAQLQYSDRIAKKVGYSIGYNFSNTNSKNKLDAYDLNTGNTIADMDYSQNQKNSNYNQGIVTSLNYFNEKISFNLSNRTSRRDQSLTDTYRDIDLSRVFWDNDLNVSTNYKISNRKNINVSYQNNYNIPTFGQLQPLQPQTNPIFIQEGNPDLKRASNNSFNLNYNTMSLLKGTSWNINSGIRMTANPIVNKRTIDADRVTRSTYVNVDGRSSWSANLNSNFNKPIFNKKVQMNLFSGANYNNGFSFIRYKEDSDNANNTPYELNNSQTSTIFLGAGINEQDSKVLDYDFNWRINANNQRNSLQRNLNSTSFGTNGSAYLRYFLPKQFNVTSNLVYSLDGPTKLYNKSIQQFYTNLELSKKLLKNQSLVASVKAFDIFNTYNRVNRDVSETNFSESTQLILTRYVLFGLKWDFNKNLGKKKDE